MSQKSYVATAIARAMIFMKRMLIVAMLVLLGGGFAFFIVALMGPLYNMVGSLGGVQ